MGLAWIAVWPLRAGGCLPAGGRLSCEIGARSLLGLDLGVPAGDFQFAVLALTAIAAAGLLGGLLGAMRKSRQLEVVAVGFAVLGGLLLLAVGAVLRSGAAGLPNPLTAGEAVAGATLIIGAVVAIVRLRQSRRDRPLSLRS
jgi:hypothetical protein